MIVLAAGAAFLATSQPKDPNPSTSPAGTSASDSALRLTDAEAIATFNTLDKARLRAFEQRRSDEFANVFIPGVVEMRRARRTVRKLENDGVFMRHAPYEVRGLKVLENTPVHVEIEQRVLFNIRFVNGAGEDVTAAGAPELLRIRWTMKLHQNSWLLASGEVIAARDVKTK